MTKGGKRKGSGRPKGTIKNLGSRRMSVPDKLFKPIKFLIEVFKGKQNE